MRTGEWAGGDGNFSQIRAPANPDYECIKCRRGNSPTFNRIRQPIRFTGSKCRKILLVLPVKAVSKDAVSLEFGNSFHHVPQAQRLDSFADRETLAAAVHDEPAGGF